MAKKPATVSTRGSPKTSISPSKYEKYYYSRNFARSNVQPLWNGSSNKKYTPKYKVEQISKFIQNPRTHYKELQSVSDFLLNTSAQYNNFLDYLCNLFSWDYVISYEDIANVSKKTAEARYMEAAKAVHKINIKAVFPVLLKRVFSNGEAYFYNSSDTTTTIIDEIDPSLCVLSHIDENNMWRYYVDFRNIQENNVPELPKEIADAYKIWKASSDKNELRNIEGVEVPSHLFQVSNRGFAMFAHMKKVAHDYPYLISLFSDLAMLEEDKDYMNDYIRESNIKLIHLKVPTNKDSGLPLMEKGVVQAYHDSAKEHLPRNVAPLTNPFEVQSITLDSAQDKAINLVEHSGKIVSQDSGISETIFDATTTLGLNFSTLADAAKLYPLLEFFERFLNLQIKQFKCKVKILRTTIFNQLDWHKQYYTDLQAGGSRSLFLSTSGLEPYEQICVLKTEQKVLGIDDLMVPKVMSSQTSGNEEGGRPEVDPKEASEKTTEIKEKRS